MLTTVFLPLGYSRQCPHITHLSSPVNFFHKLIVKEMRSFSLFACPKNIFSRMSKVPTRQVWRRICLHPGHAIKYFVAQPCKILGNREYIVVRPTNPDCSIALKFLSACLKPFPIKRMVRILSTGSVPISFVDRNHFPTLNTYPAIGQKIWRISKNHIELEIKF